jgi:hypothetical protein
MPGEPTMIDIADKLKAAAAAKERWTSDAASAALDTVAAATRATVSWDPGAGEDWGSLARDREFVAMISISLPLAVTAEPDIEDMLHSQGITAVIVVDSYDEPSLCCDRQVLTDVFRYDHGWDEAVDPAKFSAWDLWWATI